MKYFIEADVRRWPKVYKEGQLMAYSQCIDCNGEIAILFEYKGVEKYYRNAFINIPLFLSELSKFLDDISEDTVSQWYMGFAPFAYGRLSGGSLLVSSQTGSGFSAMIYDASHSERIREIRSQLAIDKFRFGSILRTAQNDEVT